MSDVPSPKKSHKKRIDDLELYAMQVGAKLLKQLDPDAQERVMAYLNSRFPKRTETRVTPQHDSGNA